MGLRGVVTALSAGLVALVALAGCTESKSDCAPMPDRAVVQAISGRDAHVLVDDGQPAVLHLSDAVFLLEGGRCSPIGPAGVRVGDTVAFDVEVWAESYPMQGWPETAVVLR